MSKIIKIKCDVCGKKVDDSDFNAVIKAQTCYYLGDDGTERRSFDWDVCCSCKRWLIGFMCEIKPSISKAKSLASFVKKLAAD